jgi:hypothetical protein
VKFAEVAAQVVEAGIKLNIQTKGARRSIVHTCMRRTSPHLVQNLPSPTRTAIRRLVDRRLRRVELRGGYSNPEMDEWADKTCEADQRRARSCRRRSGTRAVRPPALLPLYNLLMPV